MRRWTRKHSLSGPKFRAEIDAHEARVLGGLVGSVLGMLDDRDHDTPQDELAELTGMRSGNSVAPDDPVLARLLPDFHRPDADPDPGEDTPDRGDGEDLNAGLRMLHELEIIDAKRRNARVLLETLPEGGGRITLTPEQADAWLGALNDVRLALGTALRIDAQTPDELEPGDPRAGDFDVYHWLTWVQDTLVEAVLR